MTLNKKNKNKNPFYLLLQLDCQLFHFGKISDDTRKTATSDSSMMGRLDQQLQPMKVRTRKTRPERNRKDEILDNLVLSIISS